MLVDEPRCQVDTVSASGEPALMLADKEASRGRRRGKFTGVEVAPTRNTVNMLFVPALGVLGFSFAFGEALFSLHPGLSIASGAARLLTFAWPNALACPAGPRPQSPTLSRKSPGISRGQTRPSQ
jgi:hypothetical protein